MALEESNGTGMYMPVAPAYGMGGNGGFGFGGDWAWIILLLVLCGGWNNGFGGFGGGMMPFMMGANAVDNGFGLYPWLNNSQHISDGFRDQMINTGISSLGDKITSGFGDVSTQLCGGFAGVNQSICQTGNGITAAVTGAQNALTQQMYANQLADLERSFAAQTASTQGMTALQSQLASCCCENRLATANLGADVAREACADRAALSDALRDVMAANNASTQRILDQLCADKIESKNDTIAQLRSELMFARGQASQDVQTATIQAGQRGLANEIEQYVLPTPRPAYIVQNPNCCTPNYGCGCGCGVAA